MSNEQADSVAAEEQPKQQQEPEQQPQAEAGKKEEAAAVEVKENGDAAAEDAQPEPEPKQMRAVVLNSFGGMKGVKILKRPEPTPAEGELLIRVSAW